MLNNATDYKPQVLQGKIAKGTVVINNDPLLLGRIKVRIDVLHPVDLEDENIPWVMTKNFLSSSNNQGNVSIPDIGTECWVFFPNDDVTSGIFLGALPNIKLELTEDYPFSYGFIDRSGSLFIANTQKDSYTFYHVSGTFFTIDGAGHVEFDTASNPVGPNATEEKPKGLTMNINGDWTVNVLNKIKFTCDSFDIVCQKQFNVKAMNFILSIINSFTATVNTAINFITARFSSTATVSSAIQSTGSMQVLGSNTTVGGSSSLLCSSNGSSTFSGTITTLCGGSTSINNPPSAGNPAGWGGAGAVPVPAPKADSPNAKNENSVQVLDLIPAPRQRQAGGEEQQNG